MKAERGRAERAEAQTTSVQSALQEVQARFEEERIAAIELRTILDAMEYRLSKFDEEVNARDREIAALHGTHGAELVRLNAENDRLRVCLENEERKGDSSRERVDREVRALDKERSILIAEVEGLKEHLGQRTAECERLALEMKRATESSAESELKLHALLCEHDRAVRDAAGLRERLLEADGELGAVREVEAALRDQGAILAKRQVELEGELRDSSARNRELEVSLGEVSGELIREVEGRGQLQSRIAGLEAEQSELGRVQAACEDLEREAVAARGEAAREQGARQALEAEREEAARRCEGLDGELAEVQGRAQAAEEACAALQAQVAEARSDRAGAAEQLGALEEERASLWSELGRVQEELRERSKQCERLVGEVERATAARTAVEERQGALRRERDEVLAEGERLSAEVGRVQAACEDLEHEAVAARGEAAREQAARQALEAEREEAARRCEGLDGELAEVQRCAQAAEDACAALQAQVADLQVERTNLREVQEELYRRLATDETAHTNAQRERDRWRRQVEQNGVQCEELLRRLSDREEQLEVTRQQVVETRVGLDAVRAQVVELEESRAAADERETEARASLMERDAELAVSQKEAAALVTARQELVEQMKARDGQIREYVSEANALKAELAEAQAGCEHANRLQADLAGEREALIEKQVTLRATVETLEGEIVQLQRRIEEARAAQEATQQRNADGAVQLSARIDLLEDRLAEVGSERDTLAEQVSSLRALKEGLDRECDQLRRRTMSPEDAERQKAEVSRLQVKLEELEDQHREAVQRHSGAVSGYMLELNQRTEMLRHRDAEIQKLTEELALVQAACDDAVSQLRAERQEHELSALRARAFEAAHAAGPRADREVPDSACDVGAVVSEDPAREEFQLASPSVLASSQPVKPAEAATCAVPDRGGQSLTLIHVEDDAMAQEVIRTTAGKFPTVRYVPAAEFVEPAGAGHRLLVVNLLVRSVDPLAVIADPTAWGVDDPYAFTYCAHGGRGVVFGFVDYFPPPFEPDACVAQLLSHRAGLQRLLAVGEDVDVMSGLREVLGRVRCSTAIAFDARQALDLVPMVKPEVILVDLSLPRGDGFRVVSRLCSDPKMAGISIALLWTKPFTRAEFSQQALRAVREFSLANQDLQRAIGQALSLKEHSGSAAQEIRATG